MAHPTIKKMASRRLPWEKVIRDEWVIVSPRSEEATRHDSIVVPFSLGP
jgi:hypothetical protein